MATFTGDAGNNTLPPAGEDVSGDDEFFGLGGNDTIDAGLGNDSLHGGEGNDLLRGDLGDDTMRGGLGNDTFRVDDLGDVVIEEADEGIDAINTTISFTLIASVENLRLIGTGDIDGTGTNIANTITGNSGNNVLDGGMGGDKLIGGLGDDTYVVDDAGDVVTEQSDAGIDTIRSQRTMTLGANIENLLLLGAANLDGTGNELDNLLTGNNGANDLDGAAGNDTLQGGLGDDGYTIDSTGDKVTEVVGQGVDTIQSQVSRVLDSNVENLILTGSGQHNGTGNELDNLLIGNAFKNVLIGKQGADTMEGRGGEDIYVVDNASDIVIELAGAEQDEVRSSVSNTVPENVERLVLLGTGNLKGTGNTANNTIAGNIAHNLLSGLDGHDELSGGGGNDTLLGGVGNDRLDGKGGQDSLSGADGTDDISGGDGQDTLEGGAGADELRGDDGFDRLDGGAGADEMQGGDDDDTYIVDDIGDTVLEAVSGGFSDIVLSFIDFSIAGLAGSRIENLTLIGSDDVDAMGNNGSNVITGNDGDNRLTGGAASSDTLIGGLGDDIYDLTPGGLVIEEENQGVDLVFTSGTIIIWANVENIGLSGPGNVTGNELDNEIEGFTDANILDGGAGADTLRGREGDDTYIVDNVGDVVIETDLLYGTDAVIASVSFGLSPFLEHLALTGVGNITGVGNSLQNKIGGNDGDNILNGNASDDTLTGGLGNDIYIVDGGDVVIEAAGQGIDEMRSAFARSLVANVEKLTLAGTKDIAGTGNALDNVIFGNSGANLLNGLAGNDAMNGGGGADSFFFSTQLNATKNSDTIAGFSVVDDTIQLARQVFTAVGVGPLAADAFVIGAAAADASDRIIYNDANGAVLYDKDGIGAAAAVQFATLGAGLALTNADFVIV